MNSPIFMIINTFVGGLLVLAGYWISFLQQKWKQKQIRVDVLIEKRMKVYGECLGFIYDVERHQTDTDELNRIYEKWAKWYPINVLYLPQAINHAFLGVMNWIVPIIRALKSNINDSETWETFKCNLKEAKTQLMNLKEVGWLPPELE